MKRSFEIVAARFGRGGLIGAACAGAAFFAAVIAGSAIGMTVVLGACAVWAWLFRRKADGAAGVPRLRLVASIALPGGARVHEIACGTRSVLVGSSGGRLCVIDRGCADTGEDCDE